MRTDTPQAPGSPAAGGVIHDLGYRGYDGPRLGRSQIVAALAWHSFRAAFGFGRGAKAKIVPVIAFVAICLPAAINAFVMSKGNARRRLRHLRPRAARHHHDRLRRRAGTRAGQPRPA